VDPVAGVAVDPVDVPLAQALQEVVGDELAHWSLLLGVARSDVVDGRPNRETPPERGGARSGTGRRSRPTSRAGAACGEGPSRTRARSGRDAGPGRTRRPTRLPTARDRRRGGSR